MSVLDDEGQRLIEEFLLRWEEARRRDKEVDLGDLCREHPELREELARRIRILEAWDRFADTEKEPSTAGSIPADFVTAVPESALIPLQLHRLRYLARGGLGIVYTARDVRLGRDLAVKCAQVPTGFSESEIHQRFLREVAVTAALEHPGIVPVYGLGQDSNGRLCYAMRLIAGKSLGVAIAEYHANRRVTPPRRRADLRQDEEFRGLLQRLKSACATVAYAHSRGFLHRDLKPDHILLGEFDSTLVVDWGLTKSIADPEMTPWHLDAGASTRRDPQTQTGLGTLGFASPEQLAGEWARVGPASDVYSLGAILYVLLTNQRPISGVPTAEVLRIVQSGAVVPPRKRNPEVPPALEAVCLKALSQLPEDRYPSAQALSEDIERWLADSPVQAYAEPWWRRVRRAIHRHSPILLLFLATAAGGILSATAGWYRGRLRDQELRALAYATADRTAREQILTRNPGWAYRGLGQVSRAARLSSSLRSETSLRTLAVSCLSGVDLRPIAHLTGIPAGCLAFSPTGEEIAVGELFGDETCRIQQIGVATGVVTREHVVGVDPSSNMKHGIRSIAYSPDGRWIAAGCRDGQVLIWSAADQRSVPLPISRLGTTVVGLGFTPDGQTLVAAAIKGLLSLSEWAPERGWAEIRRIPGDATISHLVMSPDGSRAVCASPRGEISIPLAELRRLERVPPSPASRPSEANRVAISPDGLRLALPGSRSMTLTIDQHSSIHHMMDTEFGVVHQDETSQVEFSPEGTLLATGSQDNTVKLWDLAADRVLLRQPVYSESIVLPTFDPGGERLAIGSTEGVWLYDLLGRTIRQVHAVGSSVVFDFDFLAPREGSLRAGAPTLAVLRGVEDPRSPEGRVMEVWEGDPLRPASRIPLREAEQGARLDGFAVQPGSRRVAFLFPRVTRVLDLSRQAPTWSTAQVYRPYAFSFSTDGRYLWVSTSERQGVSWELGESQRLVRWRFHPPPEPQGRVNISCMTGGRETVVAGTSAGRLFRSRGLDGQLEPLARVSAPIQAVALSPDESLLAFGTQRGGVGLIRPADRQTIAHREVHAERVEQLRFHPSGRYLASLARDRDVILWQVANGTLLELLRIRQPLRHAPATMRFSPDGRYLGVLFHGEKGVHLWDLHRVRGELDQVGLGWEDVPVSAHQAAAPRDR